MLGGRIFSGGFFRSPGLEKTVGVVLACWAAAVLVFAALPAGSAGRMFTAAGASWAAEAFAGVALTVALLRGAGSERLFWALFGGAVLIRYANDLVWTDSQILGVSLPQAPQAASGVVSYALFFGALLWLAKRGRKEMTPVAVLDTVSVMLSSGLLLWYFVLSSATVPADLDGWEALTALLQPACDLGLFLLVFGPLLTVRSPFATFLAGGFFLLLIADGAYLVLRTSGAHPLADWPVLFWTGGVAFLGIASLHGGSAVPLMREEEPHSGGNLETFSFWMGPLSPPLQYGTLLIWGVFYPPLPGYALLCGTILLGVFAVRTYAVSRVEGVLADKREASARELEQCRILGELHDTAKQSVRGTSMMIEACLEAQKKGDPDNLQDLLNRALDVSREAEHQLSGSLDELRLFCQDDALTPTAFFKERFAKFGEDFGLETHENLKAPLEVLGRREITVAHRVCIEALWNAVKHANARNLWLEGRLVGSVFVLEVRDDGCGFVPERATDGLGLGLMHSRAGVVGAALDMISAPNRGTIVRLRFDTK